MPAQSFGAHECPWTLQIREEESKRKRHTTGEKIHLALALIFLLTLEGPKVGQATKLVTAVKYLKLNRIYLG